MSGARASATPGRNGEAEVVGTVFHAGVRVDHERLEFVGDFVDERGPLDGGFVPTRSPATDSTRRYVWDWCRRRREGRVAFRSVRRGAWRAVHPSRGRSGGDGPDPDDGHDEGEQDRSGKPARKSDARRSERWHRQRGGPTSDVEHADDGGVFLGREGAHDQREVYRRGTAHPEPEQENRDQQRRNDGEKQQDDADGHTDERIRIAEGTETFRRAIENGDMPTIKNMIGDISQRPDVSGLKAIGKIDDLIDGPAPVIVVLGEMGAGKTDFACLLAQRWRALHQENSLLGTNIRSLEEKDRWVDDDGDVQDGWVPDYGTLME